MLPRVAFEYGQTWCAAATSFSASASESPPTVATRLATSPKPPASRGPIATLARISSELGRRPFVAANVFFDVPLPKVGDARALLLDRLRQIHAQGWHPSCRLHADGTRHPYVARNGGGYTLEALFDIIPNGRAEPDFHGWELKACGSDRVTLMTPEPDSGYYGTKGAEAFVRRYGHVADGDTRYRESPVVLTTLDAAPPQCTIPCGGTAAYGGLCTGFFSGSSAPPPGSPPPTDRPASRCRRAGRARWRRSCAGCVA